MTNAEIKKKVEELEKLIIELDYGYLITTNLDKWKKGVNQEYLIKKTIGEILEGYDEATMKRLLKVCLSFQDNNMVDGLIHKQIKSWFTPWEITFNNEKSESPYRLKQGNKLKGK